MQPKLEGDFRMGETLYRRPEILFRWGRLCFDTKSSGGYFISVRGDSVSGETLFRETGHCQAIDDLQLATVIFLSEMLSPCYSNNFRKSIIIIFVFKISGCQTAP